MKFSFIIALFASLLFTAAALTASDTHNYPVTPGGNLEVKTRYADLVVYSWNKNEAEIKEFIDDSPMNSLDIEVQASKNKIYLKEDDFSHRNKNVRIEVKLPRKFSVKAELKSGDVGIKNIEGSLIITTGNGDVELIDTKGSMKLTTGNGDISIKQADGNAEFATGHGDIVATMAGNIVARTGSGDITVNIHDGKVETASGSGDQVINYSGENKGVKVECGNGDITVNLQSSMKASLSLNTFLGSIKVEGARDDDEYSAKHSYHKDINGGGQKITCSTARGDITIKR